MSGRFLIPLLTVVLLAAPAALGPATLPGFSGSAQAAANYNSSKSNTGNFAKKGDKSNAGNARKSVEPPAKGGPPPKVNNTTTRSNTQHN